MPIETNKLKTVDMNEAAVVSAPKPKGLGIATALAMVARMLGNDDISSRQARDIRQQVGVTQKYFTRKRKSEKQKKTVRRHARMARKINHRNASTKGQTKTGRA